MCIAGENVHSRWVTTPFFPVRHIPISGEDVHSQWGISSSPVRRCIPGEAHPDFRCGTSTFPVRMFILLWFILIGNEDVPHREWRCDLPEMHILTVNAHSFIQSEACLRRIFTHAVCFRYSLLPLRTFRLTSVWVNDHQIRQFQWVNDHQIRQFQWVNDHQIRQFHWVNDHEIRQFQWVNWPPD